MSEKGWFTALLEWLERVLPGLIVGFKLGEMGKQRAEAEADKVKTEMKIFKNELENEKEFSGQSDSDVIRGALARGKHGTGSDDSQ